MRIIIYIMTINKSTGSIERRDSGIYTVFLSSWILISSNGFQVLNIFRRGEIWCVCFDVANRTSSYSLKKLTLSKTKIRCLPVIKLSFPLDYCCICKEIVMFSIFWFLVRSSGSLRGAFLILLNLFTEDTLKPAHIQFEQITGFGKRETENAIFSIKKKINLQKKIFSYKRKFKKLVISQRDKCAFSVVSFVPSAVVEGFVLYQLTCCSLGLLSLQNCSLMGRSDSLCPLFSLYTPAASWISGEHFWLMFLWKEKWLEMTLWSEASIPLHWHPLLSASFCSLVLIM